MNDIEIIAVGEEALKDESNSEREDSNYTQESTPFHNTLSETFQIIEKRINTLQGDTKCHILDSCSAEANSQLWEELEIEEVKA